MESIHEFFPSAFIMERIRLFLPSILIITSIAAATNLYLWRTNKAFELKGIDWVKAHAWACLWKLKAPTLFVWAPTAEELVYRAPIIVIFSAMSENAWYGVIASGVLFGLTHLKNQGEEIDQLFEEDGGRYAKIAFKLLHVIITMCMGMLCGYYGIQYQSIWVSVGLHAAWNLFVPFLFSLLGIVLMVIFSIAESVYEKAWWKWKLWRKLRKTN